MKKLSLLLFAFGLSAVSMAQGWPANYDGVMLQGFYWDSFSDSKWKNIEAQADELSQYFDLIWVPQSGKAQNSPSMGYDVLYYWNQNSSFGTEEQLRSMIKALKERGTGVVADVVVNHRGNLSSWVDFPAETYNGVTYEMKSTDIVSNDDDGATANNNPGVSLSPNKDEGEGWAGMRDLDHQSENVQTIVKAYTKYLVDDLGYTGFRYDMVKGFSGTHVADYNLNAGVKYSVGECFDGNVSTVKSWINKTKVDNVPQSAAFDFPFRYTCRDAANGDWSKLKTTSLISDEAYRQYSVTFIENHDTEKRSNADQDPIKKDTLALNAWMLSMPGTPCVFLKHWQDWKSDIKNMIEIRHLVGVNNLSTYSDFASNQNYFVRKVTGTNGQLAISVGTYTGSVGAQFQEILSGYHYRYFVSKSLNTVWIGTPSGVYQEGSDIKIQLTAISDSEGEIIYTTDGSKPSATNGKKVSSGAELTIGQNAALQAGLLINGEVVGIQKREYAFADIKEKEETYEIPDFCTIGEGEACAFFVAPDDWTGPIKVWVWDAGDGNKNYTGGNWPGVEAVNIGQTADGRSVWKWSYTKTFNVKKPMIIFNNAGSPQTADLEFVQGGYYNEKGLVGVVSATSSLEEISLEENMQDPVIIDLQGLPVKTLIPGQLYIRNGRKIFMK